MISQTVNVVSEVPHGIVLGRQLLRPYTTELSSILDPKLYGYADDSNMVAVAASPGERVAVIESPNRYLNSVC